MSKNVFNRADTAISKNSFKLPGSASVIKPDSDQIKLDQSTVMKLDSTCLNRLAGALKVFETEFANVPECFVKNGLPLHGTKSDTLKSILPKSGDEAPPNSVEDQEDDLFAVYDRKRNSGRNRYWIAII